MTIEITKAYLDAEKFVHIEAIDVSEERMMYLERWREDVEETIEFVFDSKNFKTFRYLRRWCKNQKATANCKTWGEVLQSLEGIITEGPSRYYRRWEY